MVKQALPARSQTLEFRLDPEAKIAFPIAKWTRLYTEVADSQKESRTFPVTELLCCSAPVTFLSCNVRTRMLLSPATPLFLTQATDILDYVTEVCSRGYKRRYFSKGH